jgi:hypothetical protein
MLKISLLLLSKAMVIGLIFKFNRMSQGYAVMTGEQMSKLQGDGLIATAPELIALSAFDQKNQFEKFASAMLVNAAAFYAKINKSRVCVPENATNFLKQFESSLSQSRSSDSEALRANCKDYLTTFFKGYSFLTAVIDNKNSLVMSYRRDGTIIVFRKSLNNEGLGSFLPVFATSDAVTQKLPIAFFEDFQILENDIVIVANTYIKSLTLLSHFTLAVNLAILAAMNPREFVLPRVDSLLNLHINELIESIQNYKVGQSESKSSTKSIYSFMKEESHSGSFGTFLRNKSKDEALQKERPENERGSGNGHARGRFRSEIKTIPNKKNTPFIYNHQRNSNSFGNPNHGTIKETPRLSVAPERQIEYKSGVFPFYEIAEKEQKPQGTNTFPKYEPQGFNTHAALDLREYEESEFSNTFVRNCEIKSDLKSLFDPQEKMKESVFVFTNESNQQEKRRYQPQTHQIEESFVIQEPGLLSGTNQALKIFKHNIDESKFKDLLENILPKHQTELRQDKVTKGQTNLPRIYIQKEVSDALSDIFRFESEHVEFFINNTDPQIFATRISEIVEKVSKTTKAEDKSYKPKKEESEERNSKLPANFALVTGFIVNSLTTIPNGFYGDMPTKENFEERIQNITEEAKVFLNHQLTRGFRGQIRQQKTLI